MGLNTVTLGALNWGDRYWSRFGERFLASIARCDPQPDRIIIATDKPLEGLPENITQLVYPGGFMGINLIARDCGTDWLFFSGVDDELLPDSFADIHGEEDAIGFAGQQAGETTTIAYPPPPGLFEQTHLLVGNPMNGGYMFRCSTLMEIPFREYIYPDEVLFSEWAYFGKKVKLENRVRIIWHRWSGSQSWPANAAGERQAQEFKRRLNAGLIQKGVPE